MLQASSPNVQMRSPPVRLEHQNTVLISDEPDVISTSPPLTCKLEGRLSFHGQSRSHGHEKFRYGELVVLGYNCTLITGDRGRKRSKFALCKRTEANGVRPSKKHVVNNPKESKIIQDKEQHSVSYTLSRSQSVIVQYERDKDTDMFQIGRSSEAPIDCIVMDTVPGPHRNKGNSQCVAQSTISRFSCRICVDRNPPYTARIFAAGFDSHRNIFLGEKASKWHKQNGDVDGLTTNGILIMHPRGQLTVGNCQPGIWREVSVGGGVYSLRATRSVPSKSQKIDTETNVLQDGTLIDLCGATLLWRSDGGLEQAPTSNELEEYIEKINAARPQCPVGLNTLVLPKKNAKIDKNKQPYVYLTCGHVHGEHNWGAEDKNGKRTCPMCLTEGPFVQVQVGCESSIFVDNETLTHAFTPCAHMASEATVKYWASVAIPYGCQGFQAMCPFCATPLTGDHGYIKLIFQDNTEF